MHKTKLKNRKNGSATEKTNIRFPKLKKKSELKKNLGHAFFYRRRKNIPSILF
jgi:hypothetical protein